MRAFKINEISAVDRPAQTGARAVIMKRDNRDLAAELSASNREFSKLLDQYKHPGADIYRSAFQKAAPRVEKTEAEATPELRKALDEGELKNWSPDDFDSIIKQLAEDHARPNETSAQSYTRVITEHQAGRLLYKRYRAAALGGTFAASEFGADTEEARIAKQADLDGENHAKLHSMAIDMQRAKPGLSYQRAFATVYTARAPVADDPIGMGRRQHDARRRSLQRTKQPSWARVRLSQSASNARSHAAGGVWAEGVNLSFVERRGAAG